MLTRVKIVSCKYVEVLMVAMAAHRKVAAIHELAAEAL
jgi:hypothetical protein